jgi:hypothetical protein
MKIEWKRLRNERYKKEKRKIALEKKKKERENLSTGQIPSIISSSSDDPQLFTTRKGGRKVHTTKFMDNPA